MFWGENVSFMLYFKITFRLFRFTMFDILTFVWSSFLGLQNGLLKREIGSSGFGYDRFYKIYENTSYGEN